jgi:hypothetical protein
VQSTYYSKVEKHYSKRNLLWYQSHKKTNRLLVFPVSFFFFSMAESTFTTDSSCTTQSSAFNIPHMNHSPSIKLTKDNYMAWQFQFLAYLRGQDVYGFIDGMILPPVQLIVNSVTTLGSPVMIANPEYLSWYQRDQLIINVLVSTLSDSYVSHAVGCTTSCALW